MLPAMLPGRRTHNAPHLARTVYSGRAHGHTATELPANEFAPGDLAALGHKVRLRGPCSSSQDILRAPSRVLHGTRKVPSPRKERGFRGEDLSPSRPDFVAAGPETRLQSQVASSIGPLPAIKTGNLVLSAGRCLRLAELSDLARIRDEQTTLECVCCCHWATRCGKRFRNSPGALSLGHRFANLGTQPISTQTTGGQSRTGVRNFHATCNFELIATKRNGADRHAAA